MPCRATLSRFTVFSYDNKGFFPASFMEVAPYVYHAMMIFLVLRQGFCAKNELGEFSMFYGVQHSCRIVTLFT
jgi:hypothetical protein